MLAGDKILEAKKLIEQFIDDNLKHLGDSDDVPEAFDEFWNKEKRNTSAMCKEEDIDPDSMNKIIGDYLYSNQTIQRDDVIQSLNETPKLLDRKPIAERALIGYIRC